MLELSIYPRQVRQFLGNKDETLKMVDPALGGRYEVEQLGRVTHAAQLCIHNSPIQRPQMSQVHTPLSLHKCIHLTFYFLFGAII